MKGSLDHDHHQDYYNTSKRKWQDNNNINNNRHHHRNSQLGSFSTSTVMNMAPQITVVLEGRSICQRINLHKHSSYQSLAKALQVMFAMDNCVGDDDLEVYPVSNHDDPELALSNAVPGHLVAYEDMEDDLLLVGDLNWKDFVRVAKRIRIIPLKANSRKGRVEEP
ncbi:hypothetical protein Syun_002220 [Stephania yunnanensis]|uniref:Auxin-responsive protein n=1 Tax=Stephania yunnanensis TaxID=152371 RepID=A0AAP0Q782_9MAGN